MSKETIEVPVKWLERLIVLGEQTDVKVIPGVPGLNIQPTINNSSLVRLKGYIESAETLLKEVKDEYQTFEENLERILAKHNGELGVTWEDPDVVTPDTLRAIINLIEEEYISKDIVRRGYVSLEVIKKMSHKNYKVN